MYNFHPSDKKQDNFQYPSYRHCKVCCQPIPEDREPDSKHPMCEWCRISSRKKRRRYLEKNKLKELNKNYD